MKIKRLISAAIALLLVASLPVTAFAADWYLEDGDITVSADSSGQTVTQGSAAVEDAAPVIKQRDSSTATTNTVTITAVENQTANVTLKDVNIDVSGTGDLFTFGSAAVSTGGKGSVTIELDGGNTLKSGYNRAGLEKNNTGSLTITDANNYSGSLDATGGAYGAGIGSGWGTGNGSNITITGGEIDTAGGFYAAGIGGSVYGSGSNITISGGTTNAKGGGSAAGIGGGMGGSGSDITVSGDARVQVQGGQRGAYGAGAPIGNGGDQKKGTPVDGAEVEPDVSELTAEGKIEYYAPGADMEKDAPIEDKTVIGKHVHEWDAGVETKAPTCTETGVRIDTCISGETKSFTRTVELPLLEHEFKDYVSDNNASYTQDGTKTAKCVWYDQCGKTHTVPDEGSRLIRTETAPLYRVKDADGRDLSYKTERKNGVLTVTVDADFAILMGKLVGIGVLKAQGVEKLVFVTKSAKSTFTLADLLGKDSWDGEYKLTHGGKTVTFTLGAKNIDVSGVLEKA